MRRTLALFLLTAACAMAQAPFGLVIHGGAGNVTPERVAPAGAKAYREGLDRALSAGYAILEKGGTALDAVEAAICVLEDNPLFNAGKGAVFTHDGKHEMDASIMNGKTLEAGAVAGITGLKNPIILAKAIMEHSGHVLLCGEGAAEFARKMKKPNLTIRIQKKKNSVQWEL